MILEIKLDENNTSHFPMKSSTNVTEKYINRNTMHPRK